MRTFLLKLFLLLSVVFVSEQTMAQLHQWRDVYHVKKKDTMYGIATKYGLTVEELKDANPELKSETYVLKKGDTLFIPFSGQKVQTPTENAASVKPESTTVDRSDMQQRAIRMGVMLPLHNVDGDGLRMVEYYRGLLMACDSLKKEGISIQVNAWNVPIDADIRLTLLEQNAKECDIIFGPLYTKQVKPLSDFCERYNIKMVIPFSISGNDVEECRQIFQVYQSANAVNEHSVGAFIERFADYNAVIVDCNDSTSHKGVFTGMLRKQLEKKGMPFRITNLTASDDNFINAFSNEKPNVVVLNTGRQGEMVQVFNRLTSLAQQLPQTTLSFFGYPEWLNYAQTQRSNFYKFDVYVPTNYYYNSFSAKTKDIEKNYRQWFHTTMQQRLPRLAITGFDHGMFFLKGLHLYGEQFVGDKAQRTNQPLQSGLRFQQVNGAGYQNQTFMLIHYMKTGKIQSLNY